jgi:hypothetical protein
MKEKFFTLLIVFFSINLCAQMPQEWPYEIGKPLDDYFYSTTKNYKLNYSLTNKYDCKVFKLFVEVKDINLEVLADEFDAIVQIDNRYLNIKLGFPDNENGVYDISFVDIAGVKKRDEIIINSGCYYEGGCGTKKIVIFNHINGELSVIEFSDWEDFERLGSEGEILISHQEYNEKLRGCYLIKQSYKLSKYSITKTKTIFRKRKFDEGCAG